MFMDLGCPSTVKTLTKILYRVTKITFTIATTPPDLSKLRQDLVAYNFYGSQELVYTICFTQGSRTFTILILALHVINFKSKNQVRKVYI